MNIQDSTVLVTGANRGIGKAFAGALLDRGAAKVYAAVRDVTTITDRRLVPIQLDVTDADRVAAVARELDDVQVVVNNAGVLHVGVPLSASLDAARVELETNYLSLVSITQAFAPVLERNGGGAFINVLSVFSWVATPLLTTYSASKAAAWAFTNAARIELRRQGTHVVGVHAAASTAFFHGFSAGCLLAAGVSGAAAIVTLRLLPAQPAARTGATVPVEGSVALGEEA